MNTKHPYKIMIYIIFIIGLTSCKKCCAMPAPIQYNYADVDFTGHLRNHLLSNRAIILRGSNHKKITIGNEKVAKKYRSSGISHVSLHLHHILFKGMRNTFPGIPFLCMQTPKQHHRKYHNDAARTNINFHNFNNMLDYFGDLQTSILNTSNSMQTEANHGQYSNICVKAAELAISCQKHWISYRYSWLYNIQNGKHLILAQRLIAKDCFPNNILANKSICQQKINYIKEEIALSKFAVSKINDNDPASHLKQLLKARIKALNVYTNSSITLTSDTAYNMANNRYGDSERFYDPKKNTSNEDLSDASILD
uniref:Ycf1 n=1 Tax=Grateloupia filicina TaxID=31455 RepID=A0A2S1FX14_9FLOR|nr:hypothetical protein Grafi_p224 [Grateloupia filicina]AWD77306.1 hypothetical protein Grafi_p224 [Grateloupia filicina]